MDLGMPGVGAILACPVCESSNGRLVRAGIIGDDLGLSLLSTTLPFVVILGITAAIHFGWGRPNSARKDRRGT
jgi:arginine exporter protein ArgO